MPRKRYAAERIAEKRYRDTHKAETRARYLKWRRTPQGRKTAGRAQRRYAVKRKYGLSPEQLLVLENVKVCPICSRPATAIDHSHTTGKVRGRLCNACNLGLGMFLDSPELLRVAAEYLEMHRSA